MTALGTGLSRKRRIQNTIACSGLVVCVLAALIPLIAVLSYTLARGLGRVSAQFLTHSMRGVGPIDTNGGIYHAMLGTLEQVGIAIFIAVPLGIFVAVFLVEQKQNRLATPVRFIVDVMTGIPSIVAGLFIFSFWVIGLHQGFSGLAAGMALAILMLPVVVRTVEEMLKLVPNDLREASFALGASRWKTFSRVSFPCALPGITTGVMLAICRVTGETAPLLLTAFGFDAIRQSPLHGPQSGLPLFVFSQAGSPFDVAVDRAWGAAVVLIVLVMILVAIARLVSHRNRLGA